MRIALASGNPGKLRELRRLLPDWDVDALDTAGIGEETGTTYEENARAKASWGRARAGSCVWVIGEDSGLEVAALGGAPGIRSARYAGVGSSDDANVDRLLRQLDGVQEGERTARYVAVVVALSPGGSELVARGTLDGSIAPARRGTAGFGYDPVFVPAAEVATVGELGEAWKDCFSHRARAIAALRALVIGEAGSGVSPGG